MEAGEPGGELERDEDEAARWMATLMAVGKKRDEAARAGTEARTTGGGGSAGEGGTGMGANGALMKKKKKSKLNFAFQ